MLKKQLFQESVEDFFRKQSLDESQRDRLRTCLTNSRYSRLSYSRTSDRLLDECVLIDNTASSGKTSPTSSSVEKPATTIKQKEDELNRAFEILSETNTTIRGLQKLTSLVNDKEEIEALIESLSSQLAKSPQSPQRATTSPEDHFLSLQKLSPDEEVYINEQDRYRNKLYLDAKRRIAKKVAEKTESSGLSTLNALKDQQKVSKDENTEYILKRVQNRPRKERLEQIEATLTGITTRLREFKEKYESSSKSTKSTIPNRKIQEDIAEVIASIDSLLSNKQTNLRRLDTARLTEIEQLYVDKETELGRRVEAEIERHERERASEMMREREAREARRTRESALIKECARVNECVEQMRQNGAALSDKIKSRLESLLKATSGSSSSGLQAELENMSSALEANLERVAALRDRVRAMSSSGGDAAKRLTDDEIDRTSNEISSIMVQCVSKQNDLLNKMKPLESRVQQHIDDLLKAKKAQELAAAERQRQELEQQQEAEKKRAAEEEKRRIEQSEKDKEERAARERQERTKQAMEQVKSVDETNKMGVLASTLEEYEKNQLTLARLRFETEQALSANTLKMFKFDLQKAINFPLNSLLEDKTSDENRRNFSEKIKTLCRLLSGQTCTITSTLTVNPTKHPLAIDFCLVYLARKLVEKSEETVASRPDTAFQYAQLVHDVLRQVKHFEVILVSQFNEKCPYTVPYYKPRVANQTDEKYFESLGYKIIDGKVEDEVHFFKRMTGVLYLYFTLMTTATSSNQHELSYFNLKRAWRWLVELLNMTPRANITAEMLAIFLKCCGHSMLATYGKQFEKLMHVCVNDYFGLIRAISSEKQSDAAVGRLKTVLDDFRKTKRFPAWKRQ